MVPLKDGDLVQRTEVVYEPLVHFQLKTMGGVEAGWFAGFLGWFVLSMCSCESLSVAQLL